VSGSSLFRRLQSDIGLSFLRTFVARGVAALGAVALLLVVGRILGPEGVGAMALAQAVLMGASLMARGGMDNALMRFVGQDHGSMHVFLYLRWAMLQGLAIGLVVAALLVGLRGWVEGLFSSAGLADMLLGFALAVPASVFAFLLAGFFKGVRMPATASMMENGSVSLFTAVFLLIWFSLAGELDYAAIGWAYFVAATLVAGQGAVQLGLWRRPKLVNGVAEGPAVSRGQFHITSRAFFASTFANFMQSVLAVMIAGWLLTDAGLGLFKSAQQIGMLIAFVLVVINAIFPPRFAALYHQGKHSELNRLARQGALLGIIIAMPLLLICLIFPGWVLHWFGEDFTQAAALLRVIALAQLVNVASGSVGFLLNMTGHEKLMRNIALICNALGLLGFWVLIPPFGPMGAALALAFVLVCQNLVALVFVWRILGIWTLPCPNVLAMLGMRTLAKD
jgi:O-antigen/teichoic acid export membrane protein